MTMSVSSRLDQVDQRLRTRYHQCIGFPAARDGEYSSLYPFFDVLINNVGDPFVLPLSDIHTKDLEQEVVSFFAALWRAPADDYWGYVTTGSTEGNLYGLYTARELLPGAVVYHSAGSHYSIPKNAHILGLKNVVVATQDCGEIDYTALEAAIDPRHQAIVVANIGTTMTEAIDDVKRIKSILQKHVPDRHYIHSDAALVGAYAAFMGQKPHYDFADGADSVALSGHKFLGVPFPCGIAMVRRSRQQKVGVHIAYIAAPDTTIAGSRSGHAALFLWYALQTQGLAGLRSRYEVGDKLADTVMQKLQAIGWETWRNPHALTVVLRAPSEKLVRKWQLATAQGMSHIICMPGSDPLVIDQCIADLTAEV